MPDQLLGGLIINEILADPNGSTHNFDTDGSGSADATDEYVELFNASANPIDISGLELWDPARDNWFTFPAGSILAPGGHAIVVTGFQGGPGPTVGPNDLVFDAGLSSAVMNNGAETVVVYDPSADEYISAHYNTTSPIDPTVSGDGNFDGFSTTATQSGSGEDFGSDIDGLSMQRDSDGSDTIVNDASPTAGTTNICFDIDTLLATPTGPRAIRDLQVGDTVTTQDRGPQKIRWIGQRHFGQDMLTTAPNLCPICIRKDALGPDHPSTDLVVSRQHRVMVSSVIAQRMTEHPHVLVAAKDLLEIPGVDTIIPEGGVTYSHVLLDAHAILIANNAPAESLYLGQEGAKAMTPKARREISAILPDAFADDAPWPMAYDTLSGHRSRTLVQRHLKNDKPFSE